MAKRTLSQSGIIVKRKSAKRPKAQRPQHQNLTVMRSPAPEVKTAFVKINQTTIGSGPGASLSVDILGGMTVGTGTRNNFLGRRINPIGIDMRYSVAQATGNLVTNGKWNPLIRVSLVQYGNSFVVNTPPSNSIIYEDNGTVHSGFELANWDNIDCLHDTLHPLLTTVSVSTTQQSGNAVFVHKYIKANKLKPIAYDDVGVAWNKGGLLFFAYGDTNTTPLPSLEAYIRVYFTDA